MASSSLGYVVGPWGHGAMGPWGHGQVQCMDSSHVALVSLLLRESAFSEFPGFFGPGSGRRRALWNSSGQQKQFPEKSWQIHKEQKKPLKIMKNSPRGIVPTPHELRFVDIKIKTRDRIVWDPTKATVGI